MKSAITRRSRERNDANSVARWLEKQFSRYLLRELPEVKIINSVAEYEALAMEPAPGWLSARFSDLSDSEFTVTGATICWMDPQDPTLLDIEHKVSEWLHSRLGTRDEAKFPRMTPEHILAKWEAEHLVMARAMKRGWLPTSGNGRIKVSEIDEFIIWEFVPTHPEFRQELANESAMMQHCLGQFADRESLQGGYGMYYVDNAMAGNMRLFSIRNLAGKAHVTASVNIANDGQLMLEQLKGRQNRPPAHKYVAARMDPRVHTGLPWSQNYGELSMDGYMNWLPHMALWQSEGWRKA